jgi:hypothetical protein
MKTTKPSITKRRWPIVLQLVLALMIINGCQKSELINNEINIADVKRDFLRKPEYQKKLYQPLDAMTQLYWNPLWDETMQRVQDDTITWYYIPLSSEIRDKQDKKTSHLITTNNLKKYIIARVTDTGINFSLGSYIADRRESELSVETNSFNESFTGQLMQENFEGGPVYLIDYKQGNSAKISNKTSVANTKLSSSVPNTLSSTTGERACRYQSICKWSGVGSDSTPHVTVTWGTWQSTRMQDCVYPTRIHVTGPSTWTLDHSYYDERCEIVSNPTTTPTPVNPPLPPSGGGSSGDSQLTTLTNRLANNPFALLPAAVPCETIRQWLAIAKFQVAQAQLDKLKEVVGRGTTTTDGITMERVAQLQNINKAYSPVVNLDYFSVTVQKLPVVNGRLLSAREFLSHIRKNINSFVDTEYSKFEPYKYNGLDETALWNSSNPLGALIAIDIKGPDNASVIVTRTADNLWRFSTIFEPRYGEHPVSGHRDFGYTLNVDGSYTFYTRGVDRLTSWDAAFLQKYTEFPFNQADALWRSFQEKINGFVNANKGSSSVENPQIHRPYWNQVKEVLDGNAPLSTLSSDCPN